MDGIMGCMHTSRLFGRNLESRILFCKNGSLRVFGDIIVFIRVY